MLYSPEELPEEIEDFSLAEAEIHVGRFRWLDVVMRRWANQLESTLFDHLHSVFEIEAETVIWTRFSDVLKMLGDQPMYIFESDSKRETRIIIYLVSIPLFILSLFHSFISRYLTLLAPSTQPPKWNPVLEEEK